MKKKIPKSLICHIAKLMKYGLYTNLINDFFDIIAYGCLTYFIIKNTIVSICILFVSLDIF